MTKHNPDTAPAITARVAQLLRQSAGVPPDAILRLLRRSDAHSTLDVEQEILKLKKHHSARSVS